MAIHDGIKISKHSPSSGQVIDQRTQRGIAGLHIEVWDKSEKELVDRTVTGPDGMFPVEEPLNGLRVNGTNGDRRSVYFKIFKDNRLVANTESSSSTRLGDAGKSFRIPVDPAGRLGEETPAASTVSGRVMGPKGPLAGHLVRAFDKNIGRPDKDIGQARTDQDGHYEISYTTQSLGRPGKLKADLCLRVFNVRRKELLRSEAMCQAPPRVVLDLAVGEVAFPGPSEFEILRTKLATAFHSAVDFEAHLRSLTDEEVDFLACTTGLNKEQVAAFAASFRLAEETGLGASVCFVLGPAGLNTARRHLLRKTRTSTHRALEAALQGNKVSRSEMDSVDTVMDQVDRSTVKLAHEPKSAGQTSLGELLTTIISRELTDEFLTSYLHRSDSIEEFWKSLGERPAFRRSIPKLQYALQLGALTGNHLPLIRRLQSTSTSLKDLAKNDERDWLRLINQRGVGVPANFPGRDQRTKAGNYAKYLSRQMEDAFPTTVLAHKLSKDTNVGNPDLKRFFLNSEKAAKTSGDAFDFGKHRVTAYIAANPQALDGVADPPLLISRLKGMERLFWLTEGVSKSAAMKIFMDDGIHSAHQILRMGKGAFVQRYGKKLGSDEKAQRMFRKASWVAAAAQVVAAKYQQKYNQVSPYVVSRYGTVSDEAEAEIADLRTLFGQQDFCLCEHCRSVYGPAAYLVDLLQFLSRHASVAISANEVVRRNPFNKEKIMVRADKKTAKDILLERRPDIGQLELSCDNTNTLVPYVDLVNEILEYAIAHIGPASPQLDIDIPDHIATIGTATELSANPQPIKPEAYNRAYDRLAGQVYPWDLPFDVWVEEARIYFEHLGVPRHQLIETFFGEQLSQASAIAIAEDHLELSGFQRKIITNNLPPLTAPRPWDFWGLKDGSAHPLHVNQWIHELESVGTFLLKAGLSYTELLELADTEYVTKIVGHGSLAIVPLHPKDAGTCDVDKLKIKGLNEAMLNGIHRFLRLRRALGWTISDLDKTIAAFQADLNDDFLLKLSTIKWLRAELRVPLVEMLSWWASIDTPRAIPGETNHSTPSLYEQLFLNKTVLNPVDEAFWPLTGTERLSVHAPALLGGLRIPASDLMLLIKSDVSREALHLPSELPSDRLTLENITHLHRIASFSRALKLSVPNFLALKALMGLNPFDPTHLENTRDFVERVKSVRSSNFTISTLDYLFRHVSTIGSGVAPVVTTMDLLLKEINDEVQKIVTENTPRTGADNQASDPTGELTMQKLSLLLPPEDQKPPELPTSPKIEDVYAVIAGTSAKSVNDQEAIFNTALERFLPAEAKTTLIGAAAISQKEDRFAYVLPFLMSYLRRTLSESVVKQKLSAALKLPVDTTEYLLIHGLSARSNATLKLINDFLPDVDSAPAPSKDHQRDAVSLLSKAATLVNTFNMTFDELTWQHTESAASEWLNFDLLPLTPLESGSALFTKWEEMLGLFTIADSFPAGRGALVELLRMTDPAGPSFTGEHQFLGELSQRTGWALDDLRFLTGDRGFDFIYPDDYRTTRSFLVLKKCFQILKRLGISADKVFSWSDPNVSAKKIASDVKSAAKAKHDEEQWNTIAKPLRDALREKQRSALVAYLVWQRAFTSSNELFADYLVDVEMSPCQMTSRIKQAIGSIQLFIQRSFLRLEKEILLDDDAAAEWKWMKNYRVWEANRKVFLYPENWIEPELRDDKTPFFKAFENEMLQSDITKDSAEEALRHYLERLDEVARLKVVAMYHQEEGAEGEKVDILHVFARTEGVPHTYFYRRRMDGLHWTAWEKIEQDVQGDHLIPIVWNRRLYLFWAIIEEKPDEEQDLRDPLHNEKEQDKTYRNEHKKWQDLKDAWQIQKDKFESEDKIRKSVEKILADKRVWCIEVLGAEGAEPTEADITACVGPFLNAFKDLLNSLNTEKPSDDPPVRPEEEGSPAATGTMPKIHTEIRLAWTEYKNGKWSSRKMTKGNPISYKQRSNPESLFLKTGIAPSGEVIIHCFLTLGISPQYSEYVSESRYIGAFYFTGCGDKSGIISFYSDTTLPDNPDWWIRSPLSTILTVNAFQASASANGLHMVVGDSMPGSNILQLVSRTEDVHVLKTVPTAYELLIPNQEPQFVFPQMSFFQDTSRSLFVSTRLHTIVTLNEASKASPNVPDPTWADDSMTSQNGSKNHTPESVWIRNVDEIQRWRFETFYHPYSCDILRQLNRYGIDGLYQWSQQQPILQLDQRLFFEATYAPTKNVVQRPYPKEDIDFSERGSYAQYNWELFFHAPLHIAERLSKNQRFEEAQQWFHYIFDPTTGSKDKIPQRFWKVRPFYENSSFDVSMQDLMELLAKPTTPVFLELNSLLLPKKSQELDAAENLRNQIEQWRKHPFNPHLIARMRPIAYQKTVVMKYIDNLIAWGDQLFRRDTIESINEATQLYILAANILGARVRGIAPHVGVKSMTYNELEPMLDDFSNAEVQIENLVSPMSDSAAGEVGQEAFVLPTTLYFCIPPNERLLGYWDTVADRLFKIRNCMNIEGVVRQLPLFEPPIDPALLVRATAAGLDLSTVLNDLYSPAPHYRFSVMLQKAGELCAEIKALGGQFLSALEKRDAEGMARLRSTQEIAVLDAVREVKEKQIDEAYNSYLALRKALDLADCKRIYYENREFMNASEVAQFTKSIEAAALQKQSGEMDLNASVACLIPEVVTGASGTYGSAVATVGLGGKLIGPGMQCVAKSMAIKAASANSAAAQAATLGSYVRRSEEWIFQGDLAVKEKVQIDKQIEAAKIRWEIAVQDLKNHDVQRENARETDAYMREKFSNTELYDWMVSQISASYFQTYQLAYDIARRAERAAQFELALASSSYINFGYWDGLKKGLLAGERLALDIKRLEIAYLERNKREYEMTKEISLLLHDPMALIALKETGSCVVNLPEELFDIDCPGHYMRRIKNVSLTIPCVTGPYTNLNATLTLMSSRIRIDSKATGTYHNQPASEQGDDPRFRIDRAAVQSIVTSHGQNDSGLFEANLRDERFLPFEGFGAISEWHIELPKFEQFDYETISDVVLHIRYTARDGGGALKTLVENELEDNINQMALAGQRSGLFRLFSAKHEFPDAWYRFLHPAQGQSAALTVDLSKNRFPFQFRNRAITISSAMLFLKTKKLAEDQDDSDIVFNVNLQRRDEPKVFSEDVPFAVSQIPTLLAAPFDPWPTDGLGEWQIVPTNGVLPDPTRISDIWIVLQYTVAST